MNLLYPFKWLRYKIASWWLLHFPRAERLLPGQYTLIIDLWEGNIELNVDALKAGGVHGVILRLNSISGGLHKDDLFDKYWELFKDFVRFPYFVYNPWVSGKENFEWLKANLPAVVRRVGIDIEVRRDGYSSAVYAAEVDGFMQLCEAAGLNPVIYTGGWFIPYLSSWPTYEPYWWARYPYALYPPSSENITWDQLRAKLDALAWYPAEPGTTPNVVKIWQCSGDKYKLPGTGGRVIDINVFNNTPAQYRTWVGEQASPAPEPTDAEKLAVLWTAHPELH